MNGPAARVHEEWKGGAADPWPAVVGDMLEPVYRFVRARAPADAVDDLVQETFVAASRGIGRFDGRCPLWNWLTAIARNKIAEYYRRSGSRDVLAETLEMLEADGKLREELAGESPLPDETCERKEFQMLARAALSTLSPEQQECLVGRYYEDLSLDELSDRLGISRAAANTRLHRSRQDLRHAFLKLIGGGADNQEIVP